ncbi:hypothetical protein OIU77_029827 [Salix suchowensis]|uniref:Uncharacterized protein n=2 Tax=Salix suchowensis TaxID=1278906 RepID=A0ABQ9B9U6_9ROSI|nr:hypothetical protein OIU77_029827 [Salix suchowensis]
MYNLITSFIFFITRNPSIFCLSKLKMPVARDRLSRSVDIAALFAARRQSSIVGVYQDQPELDMALFGSPRPNAATRTQTVGAEKIFLHPGSARRRRGRGSNSVLPAWYPRTPLRDVTAVVRAIERRRERLGGSDGLEIRSPMPQVRMNLDSSEATPIAHLEHSNRIMSPKPSTAVRGCPSTIGKVPKILQHITNQASGDPDSLTPQKKLLNSIDTVEKVVMEELRKLKRTPSAKKAEREKRVRTLMSMRESCTCWQMVLKFSILLVKDCCWAIFHQCCSLHSHEDFIGVPFILLKGHSLWAIIVRVDKET